MPATVSLANPPQAKTHVELQEIVEEEMDEPEEANCLASAHGAFKPGLGSLNSVKPGKPWTLTLEQTKVLVGTVNMSDGDPVVNQQMNQLVKSALENNERLKKAEKAFNHFNTVVAKSAAKSKDAVNTVIPYRGFSTSREAGDIILGEKLKLGSLASAEFAKQKEVDETQLSVCNSLMEAAMAFGVDDEAQQLKLLMRTHKKLQDLVGQDSAQETITRLANWKKKVATPTGIFDRELWAASEQEEKLKKLVESASKRDAVMTKIEKSIHKYNHKSKASMAAASVIETALGAACLVPSFVGPGAQIALTSYEMATGGSEENKLLKQIYLGKRRESRLQLLERKAQLALHNYQIGKASHNVILMAVSESILDEMAGQATSLEVLGADII